MHHRDLLLKHLTVQPHLLQQMDVQLPEQYERDVHCPWEIYVTFSFYVSFSATSISQAEMHFSSGESCAYGFSLLCPPRSRITFAPAQLLLTILKTSIRYHNCSVVTIVIKGNWLLLLLLLQWVHLLLVSNGTIDVIPQRLRLLLLIAQPAPDQLQFLLQLSGVESVCSYVSVCALQLWAERHQVKMELLDLRVQTVQLQMCVYLMIGEWSEGFLTWQMAYCSKSTCWFSSLILSSLAALLLFCPESFTSGSAWETGPTGFSWIKIVNK